MQIKRISKNLAEKSSEQGPPCHSRSSRNAVKKWKFSPFKQDDASGKALVLDFEFKP